MGTDGVVGRRSIRRGELDEVALAQLLELAGVRPNASRRRRQFRGGTSRWSTRKVRGVSSLSLVARGGLCRPLFEFDENRFRSCCQRGGGRGGEQGCLGAALRRASEACGASLGGGGPAQWVELDFDLGGAMGFERFSRRL